jgi:tripartite-type tricarboxylate transporter receptor subunit TctC
MTTRLFAAVRLVPLAAVFLIAQTLTTLADSYPQAPIKLVIPLAPGGATENLARIAGTEASAALGQPIIIENRPGAGGTIASAMVAKATPDGYTLLFANFATHAVAPTMFTSLRYDPVRDFAPVSYLASSPHLLMVSNDLPVQSVAHLIALAKSTPGKLNYASSGVGSNYHMAGELFKNLTGTDILHVPYKGSTGARNDIISGQIEMMFDSIPTMAQMVQAGRVKALGTTGKVRSPILPDVPTLAEAGVPGYEATMWVGVMAPAGTPQPIVDLLNTEINKILTRPDVRAAWVKQGANPMTMKPNEFGVYIQSEIEKWAKLINANAIKPE